MRDSQEQSKKEVIGANKLVVCPECSSSKAKNKGIRNNKRRYVCNDCGRNWTQELDGSAAQRTPKKKPPQETCPTKLRKTVQKTVKIQTLVDNCLSIEMYYKGKRRTVYPYAFDGKYCVAFCTYRNELRTFRIDRMRLIKVGNPFSFNNNLVERAKNQLSSARNYQWHRYK